MRKVDCVVIGGGAAGLMCAAIAGARGRSILLLDHANKVGKKILMSGGGRCNFTNYFVEPDNYLSSNPHFCISALRRYTQYDFIELVSKYDLAYHEKTLGQLFCDHKAKDILNILLAECEAANVSIHTHCSIHGIDAAESEGFILATTQGDIACESLVIATGGLSIPTMGATGFGYDVARQFGLAVTNCEASLVPLTFKGELLALAQSLAGVAMPVSITCGDQSFREALLFTHKGLSGPAVLQISNYWYAGDSIAINFLPDHDLYTLLSQWKQSNQKAELKNLLARYLPKRFVVQWLDSQEILQAVAGKPIAQLSEQNIQVIVQAFQHWSCAPSGTEGYRTAEVTRGGVDTDGISSKTFEAKKQPGLYFIGEVLDVTGWLGGYNFQWAWASGYCAGQYV